MDAMKKRNALIPLLVPAFFLVGCGSVDVDDYLARALETEIPVLRARYSYLDAGAPGLMDHVKAFLHDRI